MLNDNLDKMNDWLNILGHENLFKGEILYLSDFLDVALTDCELLNYLKYVLNNRCDSRYYDFNSALNINCVQDSNEHEQATFRNPMVFSSRRHSSDCCRFGI